MMHTRKQAAVDGELPLSSDSEPSSGSEIDIGNPTQGGLPNVDGRAV